MKLFIKIFLFFLIGMSLGKYIQIMIFRIDFDNKNSYEINTTLIIMLVVSLFLSSIAYYLIKKGVVKINKK